MAQVWGLSCFGGFLPPPHPSGSLRETKTALPPRRFVLPVEEDLGLGVDLLDAVLGNGQHAAGAAAAVIDSAGHALATGQVGIKHEYQIHHEANGGGVGLFIGGAGHSTNRVVQAVKSSLGKELFIPT